MFRESRRAKQNLDKEQCVKLLKEERRGVLGMLGDEDYPYALPINFYYDEEENKIYFHCGPKGHKMDAMKKHEKVSFTVWNQGIQKKDWSYYVDCVVIFGRVHFLEDRNVCREKLRNFGRKYIPTEDEMEDELNKHFAGAEVGCITIDHMSGKLVHEK